VVQIRAAKRAFCLLQIFQNNSGAHPAYYSIDIRGTLQGLKRPRDDINHSPPSSSSSSIGTATLVDYDRLNYR